MSESRMALSSVCRSCAHRIVWVLTANKKKMPVDFEPHDEGTFYLFRRVNESTNEEYVEAVHVRSTDDPRVARARERMDDTFISHFTTCPNAKEHRKRR